MSSQGGIRRLGLGTVQFGLDYGITNSAGRVAPSDAAQLLSLASAGGVDLLDTAHLYGDSEAAIGRSGCAGAFRIVTKTPKFSDCTSETQAVWRLRDALASSQDRLRRTRIDALLVHDCDDLLGPHGGAIWAEMEAARSEGLVERIGASVYDGAQIDAACARLPLQIVQLPWNPVDRRLEIGGQLQRLAAAGIEIHARSLFLQGLLLSPPDRIPRRFGGLAKAVADLDTAFARLGLSRLEGLMAAAFQVGAIARFVCGVTCRTELTELLDAAEKAEKVKHDLHLPPMPPLDERVLNPARWAELEEA